jgi:hypothetical protein
MVVAGLVSNQKSIYMNYISFYLILASASPHLPPHHGCAGPQTMVRLTKIFFGLSFGQAFVIRTHTLMQLPKEFSTR